MSYISISPINQIRLNNRLCRYIVRKILQYSNHQLLDKYIFKILKKLKNGSNLLHYQFYYLLYCGILNRQYVLFLKKNNFNCANNKKIEWAEFILDTSRNKYEKFVANHYLSLFSNYGYVKPNSYQDRFLNSFKSKKKNLEKSFYLYGPNVKNPPNLDNIDSTIVLTKDINENIDDYVDSILFMNSIYYQKIIRRDIKKKNELLKKYGKIFVSSMLPIQDKEFEHSLMPPSSELGGAMALGRILYNLIDANGWINCIIEGYDFYLDSEAYSGNYPSLIRKDNKIVEEGVVQSLSDHDLLYNFLFIKELTKYINLIDSHRFKEIIRMTGDEYMEELKLARDFTKLK